MRQLVTPPRIVSPTSSTAFKAPHRADVIASRRDHRLLGAFDRRLGLSDLRASNLNWKGRTIERVLAVGRIPLHVIRRVLSASREWARAVFAVPAVPEVRLPGERHAIFASRHGGLNWKGRLIERLIAARRLPARAASVASRRAFLAINTVAFSGYAIARKFRRRDRVRSVLQLSLISHKPFMLSRVLRAEGLKSEFFAINVSDDSILNMGWDYAIPAGVQGPKRVMLECFYLWTVLARYDVIHSHFKTFLSHTGWEFEYLKRLGIVTVFHFRGCDVRYRSLNLALHPTLNCCQECDYPIGSCDTPYQHSQIAQARQFGDAFFVTTPDLIDFAPSAEHIPFIPPVGVDFDAIVASSKPEGVFRVVTSSNHHGIDGTAYIRAAVERLRLEGESIELVEVSNLPYREALAIYKSADVYVGKLRMGYYNNANIETMMLGVPNMSYIRPEFAAAIPDCPIIVTTPETVYDRLREYLGRRDDLRAIGARGPAFVRAHHNPSEIARRLIARYNEVLARRSSSHPVPAGGVPLPLIRKPIPPNVQRD